MESEERIDAQITHRKGKEKPAIGDEDSENTKEKQVENQENGEMSTSELEKRDDPPKLRVQEDFTTWGTVKYRFYLFRYYHYYYADLIDKYLAAGCLWIMKLYYKLFLQEVELIEE